MYIYTYIYIHTTTHIYIYIYIYTNTNKTLIDACRDITQTLIDTHSHLNTLIPIHA